MLSDVDASGDEDRITALDHIRGLSILGILMVNAIAFAQPYNVYSNPTLSAVPLGQGDLIAWWVRDTFFTGKFVTLFSLLFGISVFLVGRSGGGAPFYKTPLFRRLGWLVVFGVIHGALIWDGDILLLYALCGFVLWRWRHTQARKLIVWGMAVFLIGTVIVLAPTGGVATPAVIDNAAAVIATRAGFLPSLRLNATIWADTVITDTLTFAPRTLGLMLLGLGLFKSGFLHGKTTARVYAAWIAAGAISLGLIAWQTFIIIAGHFALPETFGLDQIANSVLCLPVALGYASVLVILGRIKRSTVLLHPLACAGRMAFTNYLMQSLAMTAMFYGGRGPHLLGMPWFGEMNQAALVPVVLCVWIAQLVFSTLWLRWFRYGPFEWFWRCLTYQKWVAI